MQVSGNDPTTFWHWLTVFSLNPRTRDPVWNEKFKLNVKDPASQFLQVCMCLIVSLKLFPVVIF